MPNELSEATRDLVRSRIADYDALDPEKQAIEAVRVIAKDFHLYRQRNLLIKHKDTGQLVPFEPNWEQSQLINAVLEDVAIGRPVRYIILKDRQVGISTAIEALCFWWTTTHRNVTSVIMAHEVGASNNLYEMFRRFYDNAHPFFQPSRKYNTRKDLVFDVEDDAKEEDRQAGRKSQGLGSQIKTLVAAEGRGRSDTPRFFHGSEVAFWDDSADVLAGALQGVPLAPDTFEFLESTGNGVSGFFYREWQLAKKGESSFRPLFFAWHQHSGYELNGSLEVYDEEEQKLLELFQRAGYPQESWDKKLIWRREKKKEFRSDPKKFYQEYPSTDMEAFLSSGRPVFDTERLVEMDQAAQAQPQPTFGQVVPDSTVGGKFYFQMVPAAFVGQEPTPLKMWEEPQPEVRYVIGVDVSEGKIESGGPGGGSSNDFSVIDVMRVDQLKTVARWRGHIDPDLLSEVAFALGTYYNGALIGVEVNNHGIATVQGLRNKFYRNLYMRESSEELLFQERTAKMGWRTDRKTKPIMISNLAKAIREGDILDFDQVFISECMTYAYDDQGFTNAQPGMFDDTVMAKAIGLQMAQFNSINQDYARERIEKPIKRKSHGSTTHQLDSIAQSFHGVSANKSTRSSSDRARQTVEKRRERRAARNDRGRVR